MGFNFPTSPAVGQLYPQPPVTGQPVYKWDGEKWTTPISGGGSPASGVTFTPVGNIAATDVQAALAEVDSEKVAKAGDTMTGTLTLPTLNVTGSVTGNLSVTGNITGSAGFTYGNASSGTADYNTLTKPGFYEVSPNQLNCPPDTANWFLTEVQRHSNPSPGWTVQRASTMTATNWITYLRNQVSGTWSAWRMMPSNPSSVNLTVDPNCKFVVSAWAAASPSPSHLDLYGNTYGFGITGSTVNYISTQNHDFYSGSTRFLTMSSGSATFAGQLHAGTLYANPIYIPDGNNYLVSDGTNLISRSTGSLVVQTTGGVAGPLTCAQITSGNIHAYDIYASRGDGSGVVYFGNGGNYIYYNGSAFTMTGNATLTGTLTTSGNIVTTTLTANSNIATNVISCSTVNTNGNTITCGAITGSGTAQCKNFLFYDNGGMGMFYGTNDTIIRQVTNFWMQDTGGNWKAYVDGSGSFNCQGNIGINGAVTAQSNLWTSSQGYKPGGGVWADTSDARIKNVLGDYNAGLEEILALRPRKFTYKGNDTRVVPSHDTEVDTAANKALNIEPKDTHKPTAPYKNSMHYQAAISNTEFIGLIAQEAEKALPEMVSENEGYIDGVKVTDIKEIDTTPLIYAMVNAIKILTVRIELLEGQLASQAGR